jgi:CTP:phosphocholine cytidylyltransferase-like protein
MILKSNNKVKSIWRIKGGESKYKKKERNSFHNDWKKVVTNQEKIATAFNKYFLSIADSFTDGVAFWTQRCRRIRACFYIPIIYILYI